MRLLAFPIAVLALAVPAADGSSGSTGFTGFRTPSRNIVCGYLPALKGSYPATLRCDILSGLRPEPMRRCELDWTGLSMTPSRPATPTCAGDTVNDRRFRVLPYGRTWSRGGFTCLSMRIGLSCANRAGYGLFLSRERWQV